MHSPSRDSMTSSDKPLLFQDTVYQPTYAISAAKTWAQRFYVIVPIVTCKGLQKSYSSYYINILIQSLLT